MAKPWQDVVSDERFQGLDDSQKENARQQYFEEVVAPSIPEDQVEAVRLKFNEDTKYDDLKLQQTQYEERPLGEVTGERLERGMLNLRSAKAMKGAADVAERAGEQRREYGLRPSVEPEEPFAEPTRPQFQRTAISARPGEAADPMGRPLISETGETMSGLERVKGEAMTREREKIDRLITLANTTAEESEKIPMAPVAKEAFKAKSFSDAWGVISQAPMSFIGEVGITSLPLMAEPLAKGSIGMAVGGPLWGMFSTAQGSYNVDYAAELRGEMQRQGIDIGNVSAVREAMMNPEVFGKVKKNAQAHAEMVGILDGLSLGIASKTLVPKAISGIIARQIVNVPVQAAVQGALGATGEALGQTAAGRELEWGEIIAEAAGEFITAPVDVVVAGVGAKRQQAIKAQDAKIAKASEELNKAIADHATEREIEARTQEIEEAEVGRVEMLREAFEEFEKSEAGKKFTDEEKGFAEIQKETVTPAELEPAAPTVAGQIEQSLATEKAERAISDKPRSAMEAAFEAAKPEAVKQKVEAGIPEKKYGLPVEEAIKQVDTAPTEAQKESGNYRKGHTKIQGMDVAIENPKGSVREGVDEGGQKWSQEMGAHYGYIKRTQGADGDHVDVFLGPDAETADTFYVVNQTNPTTGKFDEHKVMIGYPDEKAAKAGYMANYAKDWQGFSSIVPLNTEQFKRFVHSPAKTKKALPDSAAILLSRGEKAAPKPAIIPKKPSVQKIEKGVTPSKDAAKIGIQDEAEIEARKEIERAEVREPRDTGIQKQEAEAASRSVAAPISVPRLEEQPVPDVYGKFGSLESKKDTTESLKFYDIDKLISNPKLVRDMVKNFGYEVKYFSFHEDKEAGVEFVIPKLKKQGYKDGYLWIYDPRIAHASFKDTEYTRQWRIVHELGHAITEDIMQKRYGDSRREGRLGQKWAATRGKPPKQVEVELEPLTLKEAQRAVEWEDVAFRVQRMLFDSLGVTVDPIGFAHEYNTNIADASYRILTGDFGDPGEYGFVPRGTLPKVKSILRMLESTEISLAKQQGRKPTKGINLDTYERIPEKVLRDLVKSGKGPVTVLGSRDTKNGGKGLSVEYIEKTAAVAQKNWKNAPEMQVVAGKESLPAHIREALISTDSYDHVIGMYVPAEGKVYLVADKIGSKEELFKVIMHEVMGHHGLRGLFGDEINPFLEEIYRDNKEKIRDLAKTWGVQINPKNRLELTEELIAVTAETNPKSTMVTRTIAKIAQWLRNIMPSVRLTHSEFIEVVVGMRQSVQTGEVPQIAANTVRQIQNNIKATNEADPTAMEGVAKFVKRHFTKEGLLNDEAFEAKIKSDSLKKAGEEDISFVVHKFEEAMNKAFDTKNYVSIPEAQLTKVNDYLQGKAARLPADLKEILDGMRVYLDRLSAGMQKAMVDMMMIQRAKLTPEDNAAFEAFIKGEPDGYVPASIRSHFEMHQTISKNMGTYMNRSYEAFDNDKWKNKALKNKDLIKRAEDYIAERNPDLIPEEVHGAVRAILQAAKDKGNFFSFISGGTKYGTKDVTMLTNRKDVPDIIRELLGEYLDPRINFVRSTTNMYNYLANHEFLMQLRTRGLGIFMFERPIGKFDKRIAAKGAETMNPIDGLYTTEEFIQGMEDMRDAIEGGAVMRSFIRLNSAVKYGKTILAPTTQARNFMSAAMFSVMNGHFDWSHGQKAFKAAQSDLFTKDEKWRKYLNNLIQLGVLHDNPRAEELRHALEDFMNIDIYSKGPTKSLRRFLNFMQRLYQVGDDFWKIIGFENEVKLQMESGKPRKDAETKAAYRIRNGYPTYSMVPRAVKMVRRWPLIGTFVSFPYEIVRTTANQVRFLKEDVMAGNAKMAARRTLGMAMATSISATLSYMSMVMMGLGSDDDEAVRSLAAPWVRNSQLIYLGYDESGYPKYIDFSYFDPYTYLKKPITAILNKNNEGIDKKVLDALTEFLEPFIGVDIAAGALMEIYSNKRAGTGTKIYNEEAPTDEIAMAMIDHFRKAAQPGVVSNAERMMKAIRGETSASGKEYKIEDEAAALVGFRMGTLNVPQSIYYKTLEFKDVKSSATQQLNKVVGRGTKVTEKDIKRGFNGMMAARKKGFTEMIKMVNAAEKLGVKKSVINRVLKAAKVNKSDIRYILAGRIPPWRMTSSFMDAAQTRSLATANKENRTKIREDFYKRKKYVYELMSEQKVD